MQNTGSTRSLAAIDARLNSRLLAAPTCRMIIAMTLVGRRLRDTHGSLVAAVALQAAAATAALARGE